MENSPSWIAMENEILHRDPRWRIANCDCRAYMEAHNSGAASAPACPTPAPRLPPPPHPCRAMASTEAITDPPEAAPGEKPPAIRTSAPAPVPRVPSPEAARYPGDATETPGAGDPPHFGRLSCVLHAEPQRVRALWPVELLATLSGGGGWDASTLDSAVAMLAAHTGDACAAFVVPVLLWKGPRFLTRLSSTRLARAPAKPKKKQRQPEPRFSVDKPGVRLPAAARPGEEAMPTRPFRVAVAVYDAARTGRDQDRPASLPAEVYVWVFFEMS